SACSSALRPRRRRGISSGSGMTGGRRVIGYDCADGVYRARPRLSGAQRAREPVLQPARLSPPLAPPDLSPLNLPQLWPASSADPSPARLLQARLAETVLRSAPTAAHPAAAACGRARPDRDSWAKA